MFFVILALLVSSGVPGARAQSATEARKGGSISPEGRSLTVDPSQLAALQADAKKMRVMLDQMRTNLGFVATSATPLKHQFELEIDMWQMLLDQMDRRIAKMEHTAAGR
jgi:hypothetical protein